MYNLGLKYPFLFDMLVPRKKHIWNYWVGSAEQFNLEQRIFHATLLILSPIFFISSIFDFFIGLNGMAYYLLFALACQLTAYYLSRHRFKNKLALFVFAINGYGFLILNYYFNSGIDGPTLLLFLLAAMVILVVSPEKLNRLWMLINIIAVLILLWLEYTNHRFIQITYESRSLRFTDIAFSYTCCLGVIYITTTYIKFNYFRERMLAKKRAEINEQQRVQLEKIDEQKNKLFSIIGHDIRGPLSMIRGYLNLMDEQTILSEAEARDLRQQLAESVDGTIEMLEHLLEWSRLPYLQQSILEPVNISATIDRVLLLLEKQADKKQIRIERNQIDPSKTISGNPKIMELVLRNVIQNAIKFTKANGSIRIDAYETPEYFVVSIKDNGIGMSDQQLENLFTFKAKTTYGTNREKGTGMGLMLCKELLTSIHGSITAESKVGEGSTFHLRFPLVNN